MIQERYLHTSTVARGIFRRYFFLFVIAAVSLAVIGGCILYLLNEAPKNFPVETDIAIEEGLTVSQIGDVLKQKNLITSSALFRFFIKSSYSDAVIQAGSYRFAEPLTTREIITALRTGSARSPFVALTFPEGFTVYNFREYTKDVYAEIPLEDILPYEGYLFPDTYFVSKTEPITSLIERMRAEHVEKLEAYQQQIVASGFTPAEVVILASILEREANDQESMKMVSGILQKRLREDVPLQVDATFEYILGKTSAELTLDDLAIDSPFNTYTNLGLPPTPISNPGLMAIEAVLEPTPSEFYFYLTGDNGKFYYARTFEEHRQNKERYIR